MPVLFSQSFLIPTWFIVLAVVALASPPPTMAMAALMLACVLLIVPAAVFAVRLWKRPAIVWPNGVQRVWHGAGRARAAAEADARDLVRMDGDKG